MLVLVLGGFSVAVWRLQRANLYRQVDKEIDLRVGEVLGAMRRQNPRNGPPREPGFAPRELSGGGEIRDLSGQFREGEFPAPDEMRPRELRLPPPVEVLFSDTSADGFYFCAWRRNGTIFGIATNAPADLPRPEPGPSDQMPVPRMRGDFREAHVSTPPGEVILAGRSIAREQAELRAFGWRLAGIAGGILMAGLLGGWWLATKAIRPIEEISASAGRISEGNLSERISLADTDSELGRLADVLNSTFARLEGAFARQRQFTADASHELRTPVTVILSQAQMTLARERTGAEYRDSLAACQRAAQRMRRLIEALLQLARLDAGRETSKHERFDLAEVAAESAEMIAPMAATRGIIIQTDLSPAFCTGDAQQIAQVVTNLLTNAINYNRDGGEVRLSVAFENGRARLAVTDTGEGISEEDLPRIFERFYRVDKSRSNPQGRTGLGLAICRAIVEAHQGTLEAESRLGSGSSFTLQLPAVEKTVETTELEEVGA